jgi:fluoroquinolone transport system permease protein
MNAAGAVRALGMIDAKSVRRDPLLRWMVLGPAFIALLVRWGTPFIGARLQSRLGFQLEPYYPLIMSFVLLLVPMMCGIVIGFLLLDQRDDRTITALQVTPLTTSGYLVYRTAAPFVLSVLMTMVALPLAGLVPVRLGPLVLVTVAAAPLAPLTALFLAAFAANKVQGFALMKAAGVLNWPPMFAYFVDGPWQLAFGLTPTYWPAKLYWMLQADDPGWWVYLVVGLAFQLLLIALVLGRFNRVMHQ